MRGRGLGQVGRGLRVEGSSQRRCLRSLRPPGVASRSGVGVRPQAGVPTPGPHPLILLPHLVQSSCVPLMNPFWQENVTVSDSSRQLLSEFGRIGFGGVLSLDTGFGALLQRAGLGSCGGGSWCQRGSGDKRRGQASLVPQLTLCGLGFIRQTLIAGFLCARHCADD